MTARRELHLRLVAAVAVVSAAGLVALDVLCERRGIDFGRLSRDAASAADVSAYVGVISNFGLCLWAAAVACGALGWLVARQDTRSRDLALTLAGYVALSAVLGIDDAMQVHEHIAPIYLHVPEGAVLATYGLAAVVWAVRFRAELLRRAPLAMAIAVVAFGASVGADALSHVTRVSYFAEDAPKLVGQLQWALAGGLLARSAIADAIAFAAGPPIETARPSGNGEDPVGGAAPS